MEIADRQQVGLAGGEPVLRRRALALGAMAMRSSSSSCGDRMALRSLRPLPCTTLALLDPQQHALGVDVAELERAHLGDAQSGAPRVRPSAGPRTCVDGPRLARRISRTGTEGRLRSCVRPVGAAVGRRPLWVPWIEA